MLHNKTIHELRAIAQGYQIPDLFAKTQSQLVQAIELKQQAMVPKVDNTPPRPEYDARLMTKPPSRRSSIDEIKELLVPFVDRGMHLSFPSPDQWHMQFGKKEDTGNIRMPLRVVLKCAERLMRGQ